MTKAFFWFYVSCGSQECTYLCPLTQTQQAKVRCLLASQKLFQSLERSWHLCPDPPRCLTISSLSLCVLLNAWASHFCPLPSPALHWVLEEQRAVAGSHCLGLTENWAISGHVIALFFGLRAGGGQLHHQSDTAAGTRVWVFIFFVFPHFSF